MKTAAVICLLVLVAANYHFSECNVIRLDTSQESDSADDGRTDAQKIIDSIPDADRSHFISYHLSKAIETNNRTDVHFLPKQAQVPKELRDQFEMTPVPANFSINLFNWTEQYSSHRCLLARRMKFLELICFPSGCVDPGDIGTVCCPF